MLESLDFTPVLSKKEVYLLGKQLDKGLGPHLTDHAASLGICTLLFSENHYNSISKFLSLILSRSAGEDTNGAVISSSFHIVWTKSHTPFMLSWQL